MATPSAPPASSLAPQGKNGIALAGMVLGILGIVLCWLALIGWVLSALGIILGAIGWSKAGKLGGLRKGQGITGVVCGIVGIMLGGIMAAVAIPAFMDYMKKSKRTESSLHLNMLSRRIKSYVMENNTLPPSSASSLPGPDGSACADPSHKMPVTTAWAKDPAWGPLDFSIDEPALYTFHWTKTSETAGYATSVCDLDCDGTMSTTRLDVKIIAGNVQTTIGVPSPD